MTRRYGIGMILFIFVIIISGCASFHPKREVHDNVFSSTVPKIKIHVHPYLEFIGVDKSEKRIDSAASGDRLLYTTETYLFAKTLEQEIQHALSITVRSVSSRFTTQMYSNIHEKIESGERDICNTSFTYYTTYQCPESELEMVRMSKKNGYTISSCGLMHGLGKITGTTDNHKVDIRFFTATPQSFSGERPWPTLQNLSVKQKILIEKFNRQRASSFRILVFR